MDASGRRRRQDDEVAKRVDRAQSLAQMARQVLEGAAVSLGTKATRAALTDPAKRPGGPSSTTSERLRPLLEYPHDMERFWRMGQELARAATPGDVVDAIRLALETFWRTERHRFQRHFPQVGGPHSCPAVEPRGREGHSTFSIRLDHQMWW